MKTNAARLLDRLQIAYELREYEVEDEHLDAVTVARKVGLDPRTVFKTLVCRGERTGVCFAVVPASAALDLKALARLAGDRSADTVPLKEVQPLTGYIRGGTTALAAKKDFPVYLDESANAHARIAVSAGVRGLQLVLAPLDYARAVQAKVGPLAR